MKKFSVIFMVVFMFMLVNFAHGQDCGKCPMKQKCITVKKTVKKADALDSVVYVSKSDKMYHQKNCKTVKNQKDYREVVLSKALETGAKPCTLCSPPLKPTIAKEITKEKKQSE